MARRPSLDPREARSRSNLQPVPLAERPPQNCAPQQSHKPPSANGLSSTEKLQLQIARLTEGVSPENLASLSQSIRQIYASSPGSQLQIVKIHQRLVVFLNSTKSPDLALQELLVIYCVLSGVPLVSSVPWAAMLTNSLWVNSSCAPPPLIAAFFFFVLQAVLQTAADAAKASKLSSFEMSELLIVARVFLADSPLMQTVANCDTPLVRKYHANAVKLLAGFVKITSWAKQRDSLPELADAHAALSLMLHRFRVSVGETSSISTIPADPRPELVPFLREAQYTSLGNANLPQLLLKEFSQTLPAEIQRALDNPLLESTLSNFFAQSPATEESLATAQLIMSSLHPGTSPVLLLAAVSFITGTLQSLDPASAIFCSSARALIALLQASKFPRGLRLLARALVEHAKAIPLPITLRLAAEADQASLRLGELDHARVRRRIEFCISYLVDLLAFKDACAIARAYITPTTTGFDSRFVNTLAALLVHEQAILENLRPFLLEQVVLALPLVVSPKDGQFMATLWDKMPLKSPAIHYTGLRYFGIDQNSPLSPRSPTEWLLSAGVAAERLRRGEFHINRLASVKEGLLNWLEQKKSVNKESPDIQPAIHGQESLLFVEILSLLVSMGFHDTFFQIASQSHEQIFAVSFHIHILRLRSQLQLGNSLEVPEMLSKVGHLLKQNALLVNLRHIVEWKLLHYQYLISTQDGNLNEKYRELVNLFQKPDFDISINVDKTQLQNKLESIYLMATFLVLTGQANHGQAQFAACLRNLKLGIKLVSSILRRIQEDSKQDDLRFRAQEILIHAQKEAFVCAKQLGLSHEALYHLDELSRAVDSHKNVYLQAYHGFMLASFSAYVNRLFEAQKMASDAATLAAPWPFPSMAACKQLCDISMSVYGVSEKVTNAKCRALPSILSDFNRENLLNSFVTSSRLDAILTTLHSQALTRDSVHGDRVSMLTTAIGHSRAKLSEFAAKPSSTVCFIPQVSHKKLLPIESDAADRLVECKEILMRFTEANYLSYLDIAQIQDVHSLLGRCIFLLSSFAVLKQEGAHDLLKSLFFILERARSVPYAKMSKIAAQAPSPFLPELSVEKPEFFHALKLNFFLRLGHLLPHNWLIVTIDVCEYSGDLILSKLDRQKAYPVYFKIPFSRRATPRTFSSIQADLKSIIQESNDSTKSSFTSTINTRDDRRAWWKLRFDLDLRMKALLDELEQHTLGGFRGLFDTPDTTESTYQDFANGLADVWNSACKPKISLDAALVDIFFCASPWNSDGEFDGDILDDLIKHTHKELTECLVKVTKLHEWIHNRIRNLYVPREAESSHLILIPSFKCSLIPWESMKFLRQRSVSRMPSATAILDLLEKKKMSVFGQEQRTFYLVNPGRDLRRTQEHFEPLLKDSPGASGSAGTFPDEDRLVDDLFKSDLFIYLGHGGGEQYIRTSTLFKRHDLEGANLPVALLMGCSSLAYRDNGKLQHSSNIYNWLACGSPAVLTNLWDITDKDIDQLSMSLLEKWGFKGCSGENLAQALARSRNSCTLKYLNGAAPILHGLPMHLR